MEQSEKFASYISLLNHDSLSRKIMQQIGNRTDASRILVRMLDASTKIPTGLMTGNTFDLGNFDECYNIHEDEIYGKYCLATLHNTFPLRQSNTSEADITRPIESPMLVELGTNYVGFHFAQCVPSSLTLEDVPGTLTYNFCYSKDTQPDLSTGAILTLALLAVLVCIVLASTLYDTMLHHQIKNNVLSSGSIWSNGRKIFIPSKNPNDILCIHGLKSITMMWIIVSHEFFIAFYSPITNFVDFVDEMNNPKYMYITGATVSVDSFLTLSGVLVAYGFLRVRDSGAEINVFKLYLHRILRVSPALAVLVLIYTNLVQYLGNGPLWKMVDVLLVQDCKKAWWSTLLYIANYMKQGDCITPTWYLSVDMQLFVLSPLVLVPLYKWPKRGLMLLGVLMVHGVVVPFVVVYVENLGSPFHDGRIKQEYYIQTYTRFGPYVIGMVFGYVIFYTKKYKKNIHLHVVVRISLWVVSLVGLLACLYAGYDRTVGTRPDRISTSLLLAFNRPAWSFLICVVMFLCENDKTNPVNFFLSLSVFHFLSKVSYSMYLAHYAVIVVRYASMKSTFSFSVTQIMHNFWGDFMLVLFVAVILHLLIEAPVIALTKHLFRKSE